MQHPPDSPTTAAQDDAALWQVEAARYALLRRLAYAMRHHMVVHLQPIGMVTEVMDRRLRAGQPDIAQVREGMDKINGFSRAAVQSCLEVVSWLAPGAASAIALDEGVLECLAMVRSNFNFRGFSLRDEVQGTACGVDRAGLRHVLPACLLALTDHAQLPGVVVVCARVQPGQVELTLAMEPAPGARGFHADEPYRLMSWAEVQALAQAEQMGLVREGSTIRIALPLLPAGSPAA